MEFEDCIFSYDDIKKGRPIGKDSEKIGSYALEDGVKKTLLSNPNLVRDSDAMLMVSKIDGDIAGRILFFPSRISVNNKEEEALGGSSLFVSEKGRKYSLGVNLMMYPIVNSSYRYLLYAGISKMALPIYRKMKFVIFETPTKWQIRNTQQIYQAIGMSGIQLKIASSISNCILRPLIWMSKFICQISCKKYIIKQLKSVPQWVVDLSTSEQKKYFEIHDKKWFEWVLNNNFFQKPSNIQKLYGIFLKDNPVGFILIKERDINITEKNIDSVVFGSVVEWGFVNNSGLNELLINKIALTLFSSQTDIVQLSSNDTLCMKRLSKYGLWNHGSINVAFKDLQDTSKRNKDMELMDNWRLRPGYSDVPFY